LSRDPVPGPPSLPATLNPYAYGRNNPALYVDPSGKFAFIPLLSLKLHLRKRQKGKSCKGKN
jgi:hypothetical protein